VSPALAGVEAPNAPLTHLFTVLYADGSTHAQTVEDVSLTKDGGSAFSDVDLPNVVALFLEGPQHLYSVDLRDGHFEINGLTVKIGPDDAPALPLSLVYFRRVCQDQTTDIKTGAVTRGMRRSYHLGWRDAAGQTRTLAVGYERF
jgi:hypothetical protein